MGLVASEGKVPTGEQGETTMVMKGNLPKALISYSIAVFLSVVGVVLVMQLWEADLSVPLHYLGDAISHETLVKSGMDNGWYLHNRFIGMPGGRDLSEFPLPDNLHFLFFKILSLFTNNPFLAMNLYFLLTFPLTVAMSLLVFRHFKVSTVPAIIASLLYTFLPYHFMRGLPHILLSAYYLIPVIVMGCLWVYSEAPPFYEGSNVWRPTLRPPMRRTIVALVICVLVAAGGAYYAFFASYLILVGAIGGAVSHRRVRNLVSGMLLVAVITAGVLINTLPTLVYRWKHGPNPEIAMRGSNDAEVYGLKLSQLLLPISGHRVPALALLKDKYNASPLVNENDTSSLGAVGSVGFILLIWLLLFRKPMAASPGLLERLSVLNGAALLLGTLGGVGSLFFVLVSAQIRGYNRISVLIAFFSVFAVVLIFDKVWRRVATSSSSRTVFAACLAALLVCGIADQTSRSFVPSYRAIKAEFESDAKFVKEIEASMPEGSMIFQLPYVPYPENGPLLAMRDYDLFRGYLHCSKLRWSYGAMRGRETDLWQRTAASKPLRELLDTVVLAGFSGIYIDRNGFQSDREASLEEEMRYLLKANPLVSENRRLAFFPLGSLESSYAPKHQNQTGRQEGQKALSPVLVNWKGGFSNREGTDAENWRWCSSQGEMHLINPSATPRKIRLEMTLQTQEASNLEISGDMFTESLTVTSDGSRFLRELVLPPGDYTVSFKSDAERVNAPGDSRVLVFRVNNFRLHEMP